MTGFQLLQKDIWIAVSVGKQPQELAERIRADLKPEDDLDQLCAGLLNFVQEWIQRRPGSEIYHRLDQLLKTVRLLACPPQCPFDFRSNRSPPAAGMSPIVPAYARAGARGSGRIEAGHSNYPARHSYNAP
jgi:hypothetical protein